MNFRKIIQNDYTKKFQLPKIENKSWICVGDPNAIRDGVKGQTHSYEGNMSSDMYPAEQRAFSYQTKQLPIISKAKGPQRLYDHD